MTEDEKSLFEKISKGDEAAFKVIYNRYVPRLYYFVYEYIHVLKAPKDKTVILPVPEDDKLFQSATLLRNGKHVALKQSGKWVDLTMPDDESWDVFDRVIQLTVAGTIPVKSKACWINDTDFDISYGGRGWDYSRWERKHGDHDNDVHQTTVKGDALLFPFTGTGIEYIGSLSNEQGLESDLEY